MWNCSKWNKFCGIFFSLFYFYQKQMFKELVVWSNFPNGQSLINCLEGISGPQP